MEPSWSTLGAFLEPSRGALGLCQGSGRGSRRPQDGSKKAPTQVQQGLKRTPRQWHPRGLLAYFLSLAHFRVSPWFLPTALLCLPGALLAAPQAPLTAQADPILTQDAPPEARNTSTARPSKGPLFCPPLPQLPTLPPCTLLPRHYTLGDDLMAPRRRLLRSGLLSRIVSTSAIHAPQQNPAPTAPTTAPRTFRANS